MNRTLLVFVIVACPGAAFAQAGNACLFTPAELAAPLGHTPNAGIDTADRQGTHVCRYGVSNAPGRHFSIRVEPKCDQSHFEQQARLRQSISGKANQPYAGIGDAAYYSPGGTAAVRAGARCIELSGLRAGAQRVLTEAEVGKLLGLAASRAGR